MNYIIDVSTEPVRHAMEALGIKSEELLNKTFEDFADENFSDKIQSIKFNFYKRNLKKNLGLIKKVIKPQRLNDKAEGGDCNNNKITQKDKSKKKIFVYSRYKNCVLDGAFKSERLSSTLGSGRASEDTQKSKSSSQNLQKKWRKVTFEPNIFEPGFLSHLNTLKRSKKNVEDFYLKKYSKPLNRSLVNTKSPEDDLNISEKLLAITQKLEKSKILHDKYIEDKIKVLKSLEKSIKKDTDSTFRLQTMHKLIDKHFRYTNKTIQRQKETEEKFLNHKKKIEIKLSQSEKKNFEDLERKTAKEDTLKLKTLSSEVFVISQNRKLNKETEEKSEINKIKDRTTSLKIKKIHEFNSLKKQIILDKHNLKKQKFEEMKTQNEIKNIKVREKLIKNMIQKENIKQKILEVQKSFDSKLSPKFAEELQTGISYKAFMPCYTPLKSKKSRLAYLSSQDLSY